MKIGFGERLLTCALLTIAGIWLTGSSVRLAAQEKQGPVIQPSSQLPIHHPPGTKLNQQQMRGAGLFIQRCSLCHLAKTQGLEGTKACCVASLGPDLSGKFKHANPAMEKALRNIILNGGPTYMPGWKYALAPQEIDDIIAYLKTLG